MVLMGPYRSLFVLLVSNGSLWVLIGLYPFLWIFMGPYKFLCILISFNGYLWVLNLNLT